MDTKPSTYLAACLLIVRQVASIGFHVKPLSWLGFREEKQVALIYSDYKRSLIVFLSLVS